MNESPLFSEKYVSIADNQYVNIEGFDKSYCCRSLKCNGGFSDCFYCEEHKVSFGDIEREKIGAMMYCQFYYRDRNCYIDTIRKVQRERAEKEKAEREKAEAEKKAFCNEQIKVFTKEIQLNPNDAQTYCARGSVYAQSGDYKQAIDDFDKAIRINPNNAEYFTFRGSTYTQKNELDKGITDLNEAIRLNPNCKNAYAYRGSCYYEFKGEYDKAIADFEAALRLPPDDMDDLIKESLENARRLKADAEREKKEEKKRGITVLLLCAFLGWIGAHRFYLKKKVTGILYLLTGGLLGIGIVVDMYRIANGKFDLSVKESKAGKIIYWVYVIILALILKNIFHIHFPF